MCDLWQWFLHYFINFSAFSKVILYSWIKLYASGRYLDFPQMVSYGSFWFLTLHIAIQITTLLITRSFLPSITQNWFPAIWVSSLNLLNDLFSRQFCSVTRKFYSNVVYMNIRNQSISTSLIWHFLGFKISLNNIVKQMKHCSSTHFQT